MASRRVLEVAIFDVTEPEIRLIGRTLDPDITDVVRDLILAERQVDVQSLKAEPLLRSVREEGTGDEA